MTRNLSCQLLMLILIGFSCRAEAERYDRFNYPCEVIANSVCFSLAGGTSANVSIPTDIILYRIKLLSGGEFGMVLDRNQDDISNVAVTKRIETKFAFITIAGQAEKGHLINVQMLIVEKATPDSKLGLGAVLRRKDMDDFSNFISGFRPCYPIDGGGQRCPQDHAFGQTLVKNLDAVLREVDSGVRNKPVAK
jgi:hypothetical protein